MSGARPRPRPRVLAGSLAEDLQAIAAGGEPVMDARQEAEVIAQAVALTIRDLTTLGRKVDRLQRRVDELAISVDDGVLRVEQRLDDIQKVLDALKVAFRPPAPKPPKKRVR